MPAQDTSKIKEDIIEFLNSKGPSLPVHIAQGVGLNSLFTSAFLSELFSEKRLKMSNLRVGSSPVYFLPNQEQGLEKFSNHLKSKEKDAFLRIKEKRVLIDSEQEPAIRVALKSIKDFAIPFEKDGELYWKYFLAQEEVEPKVNVSEKLETTSLEFEETEQTPQIIKSKKKTKIKQVKKTGKPKKGNDKFLARVKEFLSKENIEILGIESFSKEGIVLRVKTNEGERVFIAYNKKKIEEKDLINANKKAEELGLKYLILSIGEPSKKIKEIIEAVKNLSGMEKIE
ncbi:MAG: FaeA/PapI family transcriptional regulator [Candidatus Gastranaerophilales bacterium]|jgi:hypothetical protein|nr:FaeA/PapI family transcriptional regulator [Candidatus Gastranaerophilales bacterium]